LPELSPSGLHGLLDRHGGDRLLLLGPPGVGKSTVVRGYAERRARALGRRFVDLSEAPIASVNPERDFLFLQIYAPLVRPEDLAFIARLDGGYDWVLPGKLRLLAEPGAVGLLFVDELTNAVSPDVQTVLFSLVLDKRVAYQRLSPDVEVVAAGNEPRDSPVAVEPPPPLLDRFRMIVKVKPPTPDEWAAWMASQGRPWDRRIAALLKARPDLIYRPYQGGIEKFPTPRSWSVLAWELARAGTPRGAEALALAELVVGGRAAAEAEPFLAAGLQPGWREALAKARSEEERLLAVARAAEELAGLGAERGCSIVEEVYARAPHLAAWLLYMSGVNPLEAAAKCPAAEALARDLADHLY